MTRRTHRIVIEVDADEPTDPYRWDWRRILDTLPRKSDRDTAMVRIISDLSFPVGQDPAK